MRSATRFVRWPRVVVVLLMASGPLLLAGSAASVSWEAPVPLTEEEVTSLTPGVAADLEELVGPIALYPDDLLALVLPGSTFPLQIVLASRFLSDRELDPELEPDPEWDPSLLALLNYPEALALLNGDLDWTWRLGEAVMEDQGAVMDAVQRFRKRVHAAGNLESNEQYTIVLENEAIVVEPADPQILYVPIYQPSRVVVLHTGLPLFWYSSPYPYYYHPTALFWRSFSFASSVVYGLTWGHGYSHHPYHHYVNVHRNHHYGHHDRRHAEPGNGWNSQGHEKQGHRPHERDRGEKTDRRDDGPSRTARPLNRKGRAPGVQKQSEQARDARKDRDRPGKGRTERVSSPERRIATSTRAPRKSNRAHAGKALGAASYRESVSKKQSKPSKSKLRSLSRTRGSELGSMNRLLSKRGSKSSTGRSRPTVKRQCSGRKHSSMKSNRTSQRHARRGGGGGGRGKGGRRGR